MRKSKGLTQEELGRKVGLSKSGISKIEKGLTHISAEDASILLEAMGEVLTLSVPGLNETDAAKAAKLAFLMTSVSWFAADNGLPKAKAYQFLLMYKGIEFLERNYRYEQTLPRISASASRKMIWQGILLDSQLESCMGDGTTEGGFLWRFDYNKCFQL